MKALNIKDIVVNYRIYFGRSQINWSHPTIKLLIIKKVKKNTIYNNKKKKKKKKKKEEEEEEGKTGSFSLATN